ncbi:hypothetical protein Btru_038384 [Bulinus truncatus]|nr:hypothetical protein Btru_038384 [Bulinus truncatus]
MSLREFFVDFNADENGLWMIYSTESSSNIKVALLNETSLDIIKSVNVDVALGSRGNAFIVCGTLYTTYFDLKQNVSFVDEKRDLWKNTTKEYTLLIQNHYGNTVMLSYNLNRKELLSWDAGDNCISLWCFRCGINVAIHWRHLRKQTLHALLLTKEN